MEVTSCSGIVKTVDHNGSYFLLLRMWKLRSFEIWCE